jgi:hypothetical protein
MSHSCICGERAWNLVRCEVMCSRQVGVVGGCVLVCGNRERWLMDVVGSACLTWMDHASLFFFTSCDQAEMGALLLLFRPLSLHMLQTCDSEESSLTGGCGK